MSVRHLVIAALLVTAGAAQAQTARVHPGTLTGWAATSVAGVSASAAPGTVVQAPAAVPPVAAPGITAPEAAEVPEPSSIALLLAGAMGVGALRRRRAK